MASASSSEDNAFECIVCYEPIVGKYLKCLRPTCQKICCRQCQMRSDKPLCTNCGNEFSRDQLTQLMTTKQLDQSGLANYWADIYLQREQSLLNIAQAYLKEHEKLQQERSHRRYGRRTRTDMDIETFFGAGNIVAGDTEGDLLEKGKKEYALNLSNFNCPDTNCRGIVNNS